MAEDYQEPWQFVDSHRGVDGTKLRHAALTRDGGFMTPRLRERFVQCVNFLQGVPQHILETYNRGSESYGLYNDVVRLFLAWLQNPREHTPLMMLKDELEQIIDSNKAKDYIPYSTLREKLEEIADEQHAYLWTHQRQDIYKLLGIHCFKCDGTGNILKSPRRLGTNANCDNCHGTGKAPKPPIPEPPDVEEPT